MQVLRYIRFICIFLLNKQIRTHQTHSRQIYKMCGQTGWQAAWVCCRWWLQKQVCVYVCVRHCFDGVMARLWQRDQRNGCQPKVNVLCTWNGRPEAKSAKKKNRLDDTGEVNDDNYNAPPPPSLKKKGAKRKKVSEDKGRKEFSRRTARRKRWGGGLRNTGVKRKRWMEKMKRVVLKA